MKAFGCGRILAPTRDGLKTPTQCYMSKTLPRSLVSRHFEAPRMGPGEDFGGGRGGFVIQLILRAGKFTLLYITKSFASPIPGETQ